MTYVDRRGLVTKPPRRRSTGPRENERATTPTRPNSAKGNNEQVDVGSRRYRGQPEPARRFFVSPTAARDERTGRCVADRPLRDSSRFLFILSPTNCGARLARFRPGESSAESDRMGTGEKKGQPRTSITITRTTWPPRETRRTQLERKTVWGETDRLKGREKKIRKKINRKMFDVAAAVHILIRMTRR